MLEIKHTQWLGRLVRLREVLCCRAAGRGLFGFFAFGGDVTRITRSPSVCLDGVCDLMRAEHLEVFLTCSGILWMRELGLT